MNTRTRTTRTPKPVVLCLLLLGFVHADVRPAVAQEACPLPAGTTPVAPPPVTAQQVEDDRSLLSDFALASRDRARESALQATTVEQGLHVGCLIRQEGSAWRSGSTYIVTLTPDGRVFLHAKDMALAGRQLNPAIYSEILSALGVSPAALADLASPDPDTQNRAFAAILATLAQEPDGAFDATDPLPGVRPAMPGASGYASVYVSPNLGAPIVLLAGFDLGEAHLVPVGAEAIDYGDPAITASDVVDRATLKEFVTEAGNYMLEIQRSGDAAASSKARIALRDPNGPWRHGSVYLYVLDTVSNVITFHAAFPDRFESRPLVPTVRDAVTGELILPQVIAAAKSSPEGGFVEYYFDDPDDATDSADVPKLGYARAFAGQIQRTDGTVIPVSFIVGSGFYGTAAAPPVAGDRNESEAIPQAWLARFGRTVAEQVLDAVGDRLAAVRVPGFRGRMAGQVLPSGAGTGAAEVAGDGTGDDPLAPSAFTDEGRVAFLSLLALESGEHGDNGEEDMLDGTAPDLLAGTSFEMTAETSAGGHASFWGRGSRSNFDGREGGLALDGEVATAMAGTDWTRERWTAGVAVARSRGTGGYRSGSGGGEVEAELTGVFPYGHHALNERVTLWGVLGRGDGTLTLRPDGKPQARVGIGLSMAAAGLRGALVDAPETGGPDLAAVADALAVRTTSAALHADDGRLDASEATTTRLRLGLAASWRGMTLGGGTLVPRVEIAARHDGGDADAGFGVDLGGGISWRHAERGVSAEVSGRGLLTHASKGFRDRNVAVSLAWDPRPESELGPSLSIARSTGVQGPAGMDAMLGRRTLGVLSAKNDDGNSGGGAASPGDRLELRLGYGLRALSGRFASVPEMGLDLSEEAREFRLGWRLAEREPRELAFDLGLEATRRERDYSGAEPRHGLVAGAGWRLAGSGAESLELRVEAERRQRVNDTPESAVGLSLTARW